MLDKNKNRGSPRPYLRNLNVRWLEFDLTDVLEMKFEDHEIERYSAQRGDVLICEGGYPGRAAIWDQAEPIFFQKAIHRVRIHERERAKWLVYYLLYCDLSGSLKSHFSGSGIQHFTHQTLAKFRIPLPPREEQQRIVAILDEAFEGLARARANAEANLLDAQELLDRALDILFRFMAVRLDHQSLNDVCDLIVDCEHKTAPISDTGYPSIRTPNIGKGQLILDNVNKVSKEIYERWTRRATPREGDLILAREAPAGNVGVIPKGERVCLGQRTVLIRPKDDINPSFLAMLLLHPIVRSRLLAKSSGVTVPHVNLRDIRGLKLGAFPPANEQGYVVEQFEAIRMEVSRLEILASRSVNDLDDLRQSLLRKAFAGELT